MADLAAAVHVDPAVLRYTAQLAEATRATRVRARGVGARRDGDRARGQGLGGRRGPHFVLPDDVKALAQPVLAAPDRARSRGGVPRHHRRDHHRPRARRDARPQARQAVMTWPMSLLTQRAPGRRSVPATPVGATARAAGIARDAAGWRPALRRLLAPGSDGRPSVGGRCSGGGRRRRGVTSAGSTGGRGDRAPGLLSAIGFVLGRPAYEVERRPGRSRRGGRAGAVGELTIPTRRTGRSCPRGSSCRSAPAAASSPCRGSTRAQVHEESFTIPTQRRAVLPLGPVRSVRGDPLDLLRRR